MTMRRLYPIRCEVCHDTAFMFSGRTMQYTDCPNCRDIRCECWRLDPMGGGVTMRGYCVHCIGSGINGVTSAQPDNDDPCIHCGGSGRCPRCGEQQKGEVSNAKDQP